MKRKRTVIAIMVSLVGAVLWGRYAFRTETVDNPSLGFMSYHYQWGRRSWLLADTNRDGKVDFKARLDRESGLPEESWEDRDKNGVFEVHLIVDGSSISTLEYDEDQDGHYDTRKTGTEASALWNKITSGSDPKS